MDPLDFALSDAPYAQQQEESRRVDELLGLRTQEVEALIAGEDTRERRYWIGLPVSALLTPYSEIHLMLSRLLQARRVVDLGAGYGRMGFVIAKHFPHLDFLGIEVVEERVNEGSAALARYGASGRLVQGDLTKMPLPEADTYFLYDYGSQSAIEKTLDDLRTRSLHEAVTVVGRGGATRSLIEKKHLWLSGVVEPEHFRNFSIYRSAAAVHP